MSDTPSEGMSFRELLYEVRDDVKALGHLFNDLDSSVVKKDELDLWRLTQKNARRWAITTIISLGVLGMTILGIVLAVT